MKEAKCLYEETRKKTVIALWGVSNTGKSTTITMVFELLKSQHRLKKDQIRFLSKRDQTKCDIHTCSAILRIKRIKIGIEHRGDPNSALENSLKQFEKKRCKVIICATRSRGSTADAVEKLRKNGYGIFWVEKNKAKFKRNENSLNCDMARLIVLALKGALTV